MELTEGCNRFCTFCGIRSIRTRAGEDLKFLSLEMAGKIAGGLAALAPNARLEFAMHGEPTLNPNHERILAGFHKVLPNAQIQLTTNGKLLLRDIVDGTGRLFRAGVNLLVVDTYDTEREALRKAAQLLPAAGIKVFDFFEDEACPSPWGNHRGKVQRTVVLMDDLARRSGEKRQKRITNQAGNGKQAPIPAEPLKAICTMPFREMSVCWNGNVCICCNDWSQEFVAGNVGEQPLSTIWNGDRMQAVRRILFARSREFQPCAKCDVGSGNRCGLVDPQAPPTDKDWEIVRTQYKEIGNG
jgi:radical SAM protein with 4Fe4S-binding SPASM domain